jgi:hypothetical protein
MRKLAPIERLQDRSADYRRAACGWGDFELLSFRRKALAIYLAQNIKHINDPSAIAVGIRFRETEPLGESFDTRPGGDCKA